MIHIASNVPGVTPVNVPGVTPINVPAVTPINVPDIKDHSITRPPTIVQFTSNSPHLNLDALKSPSCGALVLFEGMTRCTSGQSEKSETSNHHDQSQIDETEIDETEIEETAAETAAERFVTEIVYDGYEEMFYKIVHSIIKEERQKWPTIWGVAVIHRVGTCPLGHTGMNADHKIELN